MSAIALLRLAWTFRRYIAIAAGVIALIGALWWAVDAIGDAREEKVRAEYDARDRAAEAQAQADSWKLVGDIHQIDTTLVQTVEKIREVPRDKPRFVAVEVARDLPCLRFPDRLLDATNQYTRDLAAASGHRILTVPSADGTEGRGTGDGR